MSADQLFRVAPEMADIPILKSLRVWLPERSWSDVRKLLQKRHITINGNLCLDEGRRLKVTDVVKVLGHPAAAPPKDDDVRIRYLDQYVVIVEKPAGMTSLRHPEERNWPTRRKQLQPTLDELLPRILAKKEKRKAQGPLPRIRAVHRLDRDTSGLMVFARTVPAERALGLQFRAHSLDRRYMAVAVGRVEERTYETYLVPDRGDGRRGSGSAELGKRAVTHVKPIEFLDGYTLVECRLETGRTHQIRIHLSESGHPICGEKVYHGAYATKPVPDNSHSPRLALHAVELGFEHPITGEKLSFEMDLPDELKSLVNRLKKQSPKPTRKDRRDAGKKDG